MHTNTFSLLLDCKHRERNEQSITSVARRCIFALWSAVSTFHYKTSCQQEAKCATFTTSEPPLPISCNWRTVQYQWTHNLPTTMNFYKMASEFGSILAMGQWDNCSKIQSRGYSMINIIPYRFLLERFVVHWTLGVSSNRADIRNSTGSSQFWTTLLESVRTVS